MKLQVGLDIGSTTAKMVAFSEDKKLVFKSYLRHFSEIKKTALQLLHALSEQFPSAQLRLRVSGSSGMSLSEQLAFPFVQEVVACTEAVRAKHPQTDVVIELGGEDAKIIYLTNGMEQRMNSACAGGTGAFIDQIASLLETDAAGLNELALRAERIYPIASRCGVFAKTDIQALINDGASRADIAASVFQAVVNQTISGLACGRPIRGNVAFLGGPLTFLPELRHRFVETLRLKGEHVVDSGDGQYYVAIGAAIDQDAANDIAIEQVINQLEQLEHSPLSDQAVRQEPLFKTETERAAFERRHAAVHVSRGDLKGYSGRAYLGIDAGSTTTKLVLTGEADDVLYTFYEPNKGNPVETVRQGLRQLYAAIGSRVQIGGSVVTGYGEKLIRAAFQVDGGEVETIAHYRAARQFLPDVDFIIDIGGQDMKCMRVRNQAIDQILLNEACSSGCGSFLQNFADTLGHTVKDFAQMALSASEPVDLGSRCTVFMNSKVRQVQKEGASIADISAGLAYSVVSNALFKVIKLRSAEELGRHVVVQGGTFMNAAVLRAFEKMTGREVVRPDLAGLMGAYGCALLAHERFGEKDKSHVLPLEQIEELTVQTSYGRCGRCQNRCRLTISRFPGRRVFITGNRCERGAGKPKPARLAANLFEEKLQHLFDRPSLEESAAVRGVIGIPRVLNMYENYPFWHRLFTALKFRVVLSGPSSLRGYERAMETIPSEAVCYPAKLVHGHIAELVDRGVKLIFYPAVVYEKTESNQQDNHYNCPVVSSYPEVIGANMAMLHEHGVRLMKPFVTFDDPRALLHELSGCFPDIPLRELRAAFAAARAADAAFHHWLHSRGVEVLAELKATGKTGIVVAGHPYHLDPFVNHGIPEEITRMGMAVLTEDSICQMSDGDLSAAVVNQWTYHSRLYRAAEIVKNNPNLELVQVSSFGCGLDAITTDAVQDILERAGKLYTWIKMDENSNIGAVRIRLRSLKAAIDEREGRSGFQVHSAPTPEPVFGKQERQTYTILAPQMVPTHFALFEKVFARHGYRLEVLKHLSRRAVDEGLKYVNNDACYPALITVGQLVSALHSGKYDLQHTAVILSQTGGGCRATNYIALLKKALVNAGFGHVPVISLNHSGNLQQQPGFKLSLAFARELAAAACVGDLLLRLRFAVRPYEVERGSCEQLYTHWLEKFAALFQHFSMAQYRVLIADCCTAFANLPVHLVNKPKVGIVGEIYVKFSPFANNRLIETIEEEGGEAVLPDFVNFFLYGLYNHTFKYRHLGGGLLGALGGEAAIKYIERLRAPIVGSLRATGRFSAPASIGSIAEKAESVLSIGNQMGEGWLLPGEVLELLNADVDNVLCVQPFACLPNHILGRGMFNAIKKHYPQANLVSVDYDASSSQVNQINRIKLMLNIAKSQKKQEGVRL
ncbi:MAG: acyl-CoA dehydratase activase-related protein [Sporolactobacillus sp.]